jgi:hypothetical protein
MLSLKQILRSHYMAQPLAGNNTYLTKQDLAIIDAYVKSNVKGKFKHIYKRFVPEVSQKVDLCIMDILLRLKDNQSNCNAMNMDMNVSYAIGDEISEIIQHKFQGIMGLTTKHVKSREVGIHFLDPRIFDKTPYTNFNFYGSRLTNLHIDPAPSPVNVEKNRYTYNPSSKSQELYDCAKNAAKTDVILVSKEDKKIHAHKLILILNSKYFETLFNSSFKESTSPEVKLPYSEPCLNNLIQFIYKGKFDDSSLEIDGLLELLGVAHQMEVEDLFDHCVDLIKEHLTYGISRINIVDCLQASYLYNEEEFIEPCLLAAESFSATETDANSSSSATPELNWDQINKQYYAKFLAIAAKNSLNKVEQKLIEAINKALIS